ncbi:MMPL family transporter [Paraconexibacter sp.]|uniref:MMPL family transporter n=1 Tax=Paraconexibacter sp. TaxID=2949640 RepID=UPI003562084C
MSVVVDDRPTEARAGSASPSGVFARLGAFVVGRRRLVMLASLIVALGGAALVPAFTSGLLGVGYEIEGSESHRVKQALAEATGTTERAMLVVEVPSSSARAVRGALQRATDAVRAVDPGLTIIGPGQPGGGAFSADGRAATAVVGLTGEASERQETAAALQGAIDAALPAGADGGITGSSPLLADLIEVEHRDMLGAEAVGLPVAALVLLVAFGSVVAAGLPLLIGVCSLVITFGIVAILMVFRDFNIFIESLITMVGLGVGIDYALLVVRRFREERAAGNESGPAMVMTIATAGRTVAFSGAIVATSMLPVLALGASFYTEVATGVMIVVAVAVALTLTLLPAILVTLGDRLERGRLPRLAPVRRRRRRDGWARWARFVMRRPWPILVAGVSLLVLAASPGLRLETGLDLGARAMKAEESVKALTTLQARFPEAALVQVEMLVEAERAEGLPAARAAAMRVAQADPRLADPRALDLASDRALVVAAPTVGVDTGEADALIRDLRADLAATRGPASRTFVGGTTAEGVDFTDRVSDMTPGIIALALALSFVLLLTVFRSPLLALKAIVLNLLTIGAAFGLVVLVFQEGLGEQVLDFTSPGFVQSWLPLSMFMLLFGLSMDYEVFMVTRMREEYLRTGDTTEAVAQGLQRTGVVVTSAAAIMVAIFSSFMLTSIPEMKQMGFGLAAAILIDATVVRAALVPAIMRLAGRWNWWMPRWLDRIVPRLEH